ncbi:MAG: Holliday junction resolvase RuvX [Planctomycetes bacterium]|nr:Holliday junction resolvase RuvX [Planctomycetota bacterium]
MRYLAIDYGTKRTGLAICDPREIVSSPLTILHGGEALCRRIAEIARQEKVEAFVVGLPLNMDDSEGFQAKRVRAFADHLARTLDLPVLFQDERLSSYAAAEKLAECGPGRAKKGKLLDALAAAEILTAFLENKGSSDTR